MSKLVNGTWPQPHFHPPNYPQEHQTGRSQFILRTLGFHALQYRKAHGEWNGCQESRPSLSIYNILVTFPDPEAALKSSFIIQTTKSVGKWFFLKKFLFLFVTVVFFLKNPHKVYYQPFLSVQFSSVKYVHVTVNCPYHLQNFSILAPGHGHPLLLPASVNLTPPGTLHKWGKSCSMCLYVTGIHWWTLKLLHLCGCCV